MAVVAAEDRFGLGWRGPLAAGILTTLEQLDCLELIAEQYAHLPSEQQRALRYLSKHIPISLHGVSLGLAGSTPPAAARIEKLARLGDELQAETLSEHLAFVRAAPIEGGAPIEIGHLAAPPRNCASVERACEQLQAVQRICDRPLLVENIPSLITPLGSHLTEGQWLSRILQQSAAPFLLDLENLYANALNRGENPTERLLELPLEQVHTIHLSGGTWVDIAWQQTNQRRFLDDHRQDVPTAVFALLTTVATHAPQNLTVIIERDGNYPAMDHLLAQLSQAKAAVARGRAQARLITSSVLKHTGGDARASKVIFQRLPSDIIFQPADNTSVQKLAPLDTSNAADNKRIEYLLAQLFCDAKLQHLFIQNPLALLAHANLGHLAEDLNTMDWAGLLLMARSVAAKNRPSNNGQDKTGEINEHAF